MAEKFPFYNHFVRQPTLSLKSVKELLELEKLNFERLPAALNSSNSQTNCTTSAKVNQQFLQIYDEETKDDSLPKIPTYILFGIYISNYFSEQSDRAILKSVITQKGSSQKNLHARNAVLQRVISIVQNILKK